MTKPTVTVNCVANRYAIGPERIIEFCGSQGAGGLIAFRDREDGGLDIHLYRLDRNVHVFNSKEAA